MAKMQKVISRRTEVLDHRDMRTEGMPRLVALGAIRVQQLLKLTRLGLKKIQQRTGELELLRTQLHKVNAMGEQQRGTIPQQSVKRFAVNYLHRQTHTVKTLNPLLRKSYLNGISVICKHPM